MKVKTVRFFRAVSEMLYIYGGNSELEARDAIEYLNVRLEEMKMADTASEQIRSTDGPDEPEQG